MSISELLPATKNPRKWRFTWESNSHVPIIRLYLFHPNTKPSSQCTDLKVTILSDKSLLEVTWLDKNQVGSPATAASLWVPIPRVLIDVDSPINLRVLDDHIEVKFVLILPVDHPIISNFDFEAGDENELEDDELQPLQLDSDLKKLASCGEVQFYCRGCSTKLTRAVQFFKEMPSVNWREAADNWFGTCCCSFGGVSEKLVAKYANSYTCSSGMCLVDATSVVISKDDLIGHTFPDKIKLQEHKSLHSLNNSFKKLNVDHGSQNEKLHDHECVHVHEHEEETLDTNELLANKTSLLNGLLGNSFMVTSPYLSKDIKWSEISCPNCSCLLGAFPHDNLDGFPLNDSVHLFKCFISTSLPIGGSNDLFRKYSLERMFSSQLLESAKDELSFRTVVRNLQTRSPMLQIVLINPNSWCSFGDCMDEMVSIPKINIYPMIKVLFSDCSNTTESQLRKLDEWVKKNQVEDVYMLMTKALAESLELANRMLPPSHASLQGLSLSFLHR
ncbi:uncharacterized protein LOC111912397 [Lactuca sativa]|uniref:Ubiquitin-conjugating enzyme E2C-binding protein n=1 Tax=Lactuca sativa TaxID=4236 RepID=A0A9R1VXQ8_LACSA|nr:uncharacterized protein LOC111912397 [Lactuca sativa]KAJ0212378.1 hypothetical protein LSAT_V11C400215020 [Lactuca sativa]